ncbi:hypothetical protein [Deefgea sp. CFH1-16]|uniref:hypothetical protein n=1 Tax=Deefgea sp. CFH1-16 TaxID=2675457 RepID=UPI0015F6FBEE|nr:hypothetical protein [Deefgea sp. CFH1-16]MBM5573800.1 hypothetical protein [Deefgea sp. CFH1-16]
MMKFVLFSSVLWLASLAPAQEYYQGDPDKLRALEAQRCTKITQEQRLIQRRLGGPNQPYARAKNERQTTNLTSGLY